MAKDWSAEETARIISEVKNPTCSNQELAKQLGRSAQSVAAKKRHLAGQMEPEQKNEKKNDRHRGRRGGKKAAQAAKSAKDAVTAVQQEPSAGKTETAVTVEPEKKTSDRRSRGRRGGKKPSQAAKPSQDPVTAVQQEPSAEKTEPAVTAEPEKKPSDRRSRGRRGGKKSAQAAAPVQEPQKETAPEKVPELKIPDIERAALAELDKFFRISDLTKQAAEIVPEEKAEQPETQESKPAERRSRGRRGGRRSAQNRPGVTETAVQTQESAAEAKEPAAAEEPEQELPAVHIWTREEDAMLLIAPLRSEEDLAEELHCSREEIHARREQLKKQRMEEKERRQRDFHARRAEAQKRRRVPLERCTTELKTETEAAEEWAEAEAAALAETEAAEDGDKRIAAIRAAVSMLRGSAEAAAVPAVRDFLAVTDFILGSGI